jgi:hypothetical protein
MRFSGAGFTTHPHRHTRPGGMYTTARGACRRRVIPTIPGAGVSIHHNPHQSVRAYGSVIGANPRPKKDASLVFSITYGPMPHSGACRKENKKARKSAQNRAKPRTQRLDHTTRF